MAWWQASAFCNGVIGLSYLAISWNICRALRDTGQMWSNRLALATAGIFFTCAVHHGTHTLHMLLPYFGVGVGQGLQMRQAFGSHMALWDVVGAAVAVYYLTLRRSYDRLLASPQMFEDRVRAQAEEALRRQAFTDVLTGLPNRAAFVDRMDGLPTEAGSRTALLFLDLDRFKIVNDTVGHALGDRLLASVARRLSEQLRAGDELYRLGGDEFTVLCSSWREDEALELARRLRNALTAPFHIEGHELYVGVSIGVAQASGPQETGDLLRRADTAMYQAKNAGRGVALLFEPSMSDQGERLALSNHLGRALERDEFELDFQPIVDLATGRILGAEALVRWRHPQRGRLAPAEFIPFAEETGQIVPLGRWVLREACRAATSWPVSQESAPYVTVNISPTEIEREDFVRWVVAALEQAALPPQRLWLEVTERCAGRDLERLQAQLRELADLGVRIALDDFGTGWSSLTHLHSFPVGMLKMDRSFVAETGGGTADTLVSTMIVLARALRLGSVAEGIETPQQLDRLRALGCDAGQGYLLARPTDCDGLARLLLREAVPAPREADVAVPLASESPA